LSRVISWRDGADPGSNMAGHDVEAQSLQARPTSLGAWIR